MSKVALQVTIWDERAVSEIEAGVGWLGYLGGSGRGSINKTVHDALKRVL